MHLHLTDGTTTIFKHSPATTAPSRSNIIRRQGKIIPPRKTGLRGIWSRSASTPSREIISRARKILTALRKEILSSHVRLRKCINQRHSKEEHPPHRAEEVS